MQSELICMLIVDKIEIGLHQELGAVNFAHVRGSITASRSFVVVRVSGRKTL